MGWSPWQSWLLRALRFAACGNLLNMLKSRKDEEVSAKVYLLESSILCYTVPALRCSIGPAKERSYLQIPHPRMISESTLAWVKAVSWTLLCTVLHLPIRVIVTRAISTPYCLPYTPVASFRVLLSPAEFRAPWKLYALLGLFLFQFLLRAYHMLLIPSMKSILVPVLNSSSKELIHLDIAGVLACIAFLLCSVVIVCPLEIISLRLQLQSQTMGPSPETTHQVTVPYRKEKTVIQLRRTKSAAEGRYMGMLDCWRKMCKEEGWRVPGRVWWITAQRLLTPGLMELSKGV